MGFTSTKQRLEEIATALDGWNETNEAHRYRNELRGILGYKMRGPKLSKLLFDEILGHEEDDIPFDDLNHKPKPKAAENIDDVIHDMYNNVVDTGVVAEFILKSGWDFRADTMKKEPFDVRDFLEERRDNYGEKWNDISGGSKSFYKVICRAYRNWVKESE